MGKFQALVDIIDRIHELGPGLIVPSMPHPENDVFKCIEKLKSEINNPSIKTILAASNALFIDANRPYSSGIQQLYCAIALREWLFSSNLLEKTTLVNKLYPVVGNSSPNKLNSLSNTTSPAQSRSSSPLTVSSSLSGKFPLNEDLLLLAKAHFDLWQRLGITAPPYHLQRARALFQQYLDESPALTSVDTETLMVYCKILQHCGDMDAASRVITVILSLATEATDMSSQDYSNYLFYAGVIFKALQMHERANGYFFDAAQVGPPRFFNKLEMMVIISRTIEEFQAINGHNMQTNFSSNGVSNQNNNGSDANDNSMNMNMKPSNNNNDDYDTSSEENDAYAMVHAHMVMEGHIDPNLDCEDWISNANTWFSLADKCAAHHMFSLATDFYGLGITRDAEAFQKPRLWYRFAKACSRCGRANDALLAIKQALTRAPHVQQLLQAESAFSVLENSAVHLLSNNARGTNADVEATLQAEEEQEMRDLQTLKANNVNNDNNAEGNRKWTFQELVIQPTLQPIISVLPVLLPFELRMIRQFQARVKGHLARNDWIHGVGRLLAMHQKTKQKFLDHLHLHTDNETYGEEETEEKEGETNKKGNEEEQEDMDESRVVSSGSLVNETRTLKALFDQTVRPRRLRGRTGVLLPKNGKNIPVFLATNWSWSGQVTSLTLSDLWQANKSKCLSVSPAIAPQHRSGLPLPVTMALTAQPLSDRWLLVRIDFAEPCTHHNDSHSSSISHSNDHEPPVVHYHRFVAVHFIPDESEETFDHMKIRDSVASMTEKLHKLESILSSSRTNRHENGADAHIVYKAKLIRHWQDVSSTMNTLPAIAQSEFAALHIVYTNVETVSVYRAGFQWSSTTLNHSNNVPSGKDFWLLRCVNTGSVTHVDLYQLHSGRNVLIVLPREHFSRVCHIDRKVKRLLQVLVSADAVLAGAMLSGIYTSDTDTVLHIPTESLHSGNKHHDNENINYTVTVRGVQQGRGVAVIFSENKHLTHAYPLLTDAFEVYVPEVSGNDKRQTKAVGEEKGDQVEEAFYMDQEEITAHRSRATTPAAHPLAPLLTAHDFYHQNISNLSNANSNTNNSEDTINDISPVNKNDSSGNVGKLKRLNSRKSISLKHVTNILQMGDKELAEVFFPSNNVADHTMNDSVNNVDSTPDLSQGIAFVDTHLTEEGEESKIGKDDFISIPAQEEEQVNVEIAQKDETILAETVSSTVTETKEDKVEVVEPVIVDAVSDDNKEQSIEIDSSVAVSRDTPTPVPIENETPVQSAPVVVGVSFSSETANNNSESESEASAVSQSTSSSVKKRKSKIMKKKNSSKAMKDSKKDSSKKASVSSAVSDDETAIAEAVAEAVSNFTETPAEETKVVSVDSPPVESKSDDAAAVNDIIDQSTNTVDVSTNAENSTAPIAEVLDNSTVTADPVSEAPVTATNVLEIPESMITEALDTHLLEHIFTQDLVEHIVSEDISLVTVFMPALLDSHIQDTLRHVVRDAVCDVQQEVIWTAGCMKVQQMLLRMAIAEEVLTTAQRVLHATRVADRFITHEIMPRCTESVLMSEEDFDAPNIDYYGYYHGSGMGDTLLSPNGDGPLYNLKKAGHRPHEVFHSEALKLLKITGKYASLPPVTHSDTSGSPLTKSQQKQSLFWQRLRHRHPRDTLAPNLQRHVRRQPNAINVAIAEDLLPISTSGNSVSHDTADAHHLPSGDTVVSSVSGNTSLSSSLFTIVPPLPNRYAFHSAEDLKRALHCHTSPSKTQPLLDLDLQSHHSLGSLGSLGMSSATNNNNSVSGLSALESFLILPDLHRQPSLHRKRKPIKKVLFSSTLNPVHHNHNFNNNNNFNNNVVSGGHLSSLTHTTPSLSSSETQYDPLHPLSSLHHQHQHHSNHSLYDTGDHTAEHVTQQLMTRTEELLDARLEAYHKPSHLPVNLANAIKQHKNSSSSSNSSAATRALSSHSWQAGRFNVERPILQRAQTAEDDDTSSVGVASRKTNVKDSGKKHPLAGKLTEELATRDEEGVDLVAMLAGVVYGEDHPLAAKSNFNNNNSKKNKNKPDTTWLQGSRKEFIAQYGEGPEDGLYIQSLKQVQRLGYVPTMEIGTEKMAKKRPWAYAAHWQKLLTEFLAEHAKPLPLKDKVDFRNDYFRYLSGDNADDDISMTSRHLGFGSDSSDNEDETGDGQQQQKAFQFATFSPKPQLQLDKGNFNKSQQSFHNNNHNNNVKQQYTVPFYALRKMLRTLHRALCATDVTVPLLQLPRDTSSHHTNNSDNNHKTQRHSDKSLTDGQNNNSNNNNNNHNSRMTRNNSTLSLATTTSHNTAQTTQTTQSHHSPSLSRHTSTVTAVSSSATDSGLSVEELICALAETKGSVGAALVKLQESDLSFLSEIRLVCGTVNVRALVCNLPGGLQFFQHMQESLSNAHSSINEQAAWHTLGVSSTLSVKNLSRFTSNKKLLHKRHRNASIVTNSSFDAHSCSFDETDATQTQTQTRTQQPFLTPEHVSRHNNNNHNNNINADDDELFSDAKAPAHDLSDHESVLRDPAAYDTVFQQQFLRNGRPETLPSLKDRTSATTLPQLHLSVSSPVVLRHASVINLNANSTTNNTETDNAKHSGKNGNLESRFSPPKRLGSSGARSFKKKKRDTVSHGSDDDDVSSVSDTSSVSPPRLRLPLLQPKDTPVTPPPRTVTFASTSHDTQDDFFPYDTVNASVSSSVHLQPPAVSQGHNVTSAAAANVNLKRSQDTPVKMLSTVSSTNNSSNNTSKNNSSNNLFLNATNKQRSFRMQTQVVEKIYSETAAASAPVLVLCRRDALKAKQEQTLLKSDKLYIREPIEAKLKQFHKKTPN